MDPRATQGFLGTGASLASDISLLLFVFLIVPGMVVGFIFARRKLFVPHHKLTMTTITLVNWAIILYLMLVNYTGASSIPEGTPGKPPLTLPTLHLIPGAIAQIMATVLVIRMWFENSLPRALLFEPIKRYMRITLALWLLTAALGVATYITWYGVPFVGRAATPPSEQTPAATEEATAAPTQAPEATEAATQSPEATEQATQAPEATEAATQAP